MATLTFGGSGDQRQSATHAGEVYHRTVTPTEVQSYFFVKVSLLSPGWP